MSTYMPLVSVIMPCFNHGSFVVESALSVLRQTHLNLELIIVDDASRDASLERIQGIAAADSRVRVIAHDVNLGLTQSRNDALCSARGDWIAFCDSDDIWEPFKLELQIGLLQAAQGYDALYSNTSIIDGDGRHTGQTFSDLFPPPSQPSGWLFDDLVRTNFINIQSVLMRRECFSTVGFFDADLNWIQDWWYWIKLSRHHRWLYSPHTVARYRVHTASTNRLHRQVYCADRVKAYQRILEQYERELSPATRATINYEVGVDLLRLGKHRLSRGYLLEAAKLSAGEARNLDRLCKSACRLALSAMRLPAFLTEERPA
jgi:glycosyltransferase involved in cell wall biosynthesis